MEPRFQTSFIPKKPIVSNQGVSTPVIKTTNIFSLISGVVFTVALLASGGLFFYKGILNTQIEEAGVQIEEARSAFQLDKIQELIDANARMMAINGLLEKHVAVSKLLLFLQDTTLKKIRFSDFGYKTEGNQSTLSMKVEAVSYNALAFQGDVYSKSEFIKSPYFSEFAPQDNGLVRALFYSVIDTKLVSYKRSVESLSINQ